MMWYLYLLLDTKTLLVFVTVFFISFVFMKARRPPHFPPGPPLRPFSGHVNYVSGNNRLHLTFNQLRKEYGPIIGLQLGWYPAVILSSVKLIKEAFVQQPDIFSNRANHFWFMRMVGTDTGIANTHGDIWRASKRLTLSSLRNFGFGKSSMEVRILEETKILLRELGKHQGRPFKFDMLFNKTASNIMCVMLFGERFDINSAEFESLLLAIRDLVSISGITMGNILCLPYLIPFYIPRPKMLGGLFQWIKLQRFLKRKIKEHYNTFDPYNLRDFVDVYIEAEKAGLKSKNFVERNLFQTLMDLFVAGSDTTSNTIQWGMLFLIQNPHVQEKCRQDIFKVVGKDRQPNMKDKEQLQYIEATINEIQRMASVVPHAAMHCTSVPVEFQGYKLPAQTIIFPDYYSIHMDPEIWGDPETFRPERFIDQNGKAVKPPHLLPFSIGRRACIGENLARTELFLFLSSMLQRYRFTCEDPKRLPGLNDGNMGITLQPPTYEVIAIPLENSA